MPGASGTMSATTICADVTTSTSVRWPATRTVLPCQCGVCALLKSPSVATYQRTWSPFVMVASGIFPKMYPLMDHLTLVSIKPVPATVPAIPPGVKGMDSFQLTPLGSVVWSPMLSSRYQANMHVLEKSDCAVVPVNQPNKGGRPSAEAGEGRAQTRENIVQSHTHLTQSRVGVSQGLAGVRKAAKENKGRKFTALLHHMTTDLLRESFYSLKRKAAPGVDGVTWEEYETGLEDRLADLHSRVHRERGWTAASIGSRGCGGQNRPAGCGHYPQPDLRGRLSRFLVWFSTGARPAQCAGCVGVRAPKEEGELCA